MRTLNQRFLHRGTPRAAFAIVTLLGFTVASGVMAPAQAEDPLDPPETEAVEIVTFTATLIYNNVWAFSGEVTGGPTLGGLEVEFDGLLAGHTTTTNSIGEFYYDVDLGSETGTVSVIVYSADSIPSSPRYTEAGIPN